MLSSSFNPGKADEYKVNQNLPAGDYYLKVYGGGTDYNLELNFFGDSDAVGSPLDFHKFLKTLKTLAGSDPTRYSDLHPDEERDDWYDEQQRQWGIGIVADNRDYIIETAEHYNVTADAIAGVIYWEAIENPYNFWTRGANPLGLLTRPGTILDFGIPAKIHTSSNDIAAVVEDKVEQRRPEAFVYDGLIYDIQENRTYYLTEKELREQRLLRDPTVAIEYIGAILDNHATKYKTTVEEATTIDEDEGSVRPNFTIRDQAGILGILFQGGFSDEREKLISKKFKENPDTAQPEFPQPDVPGEDVETMGAWISQYRGWIKNSL